MMRAAIEFYFDFSSPYSYLASEQIEALAARHGRELRLRPTLLGAVFRVWGGRPLTEIPLKGEYSRRDFARSARFAGIAFRMPDPFPVGTVQAARACLVLNDRYPALAPAFMHAVFRAYFAQGRDITDGAVLRELLLASGAPADELIEATGTDAVKSQLKAAVEEAIARGVFGAPFFFVDGEPFWGNDRLAQIERWLAAGPF